MQLSIVFFYTFFWAEPQDSHTVFQVDKNDVFSHHPHHNHSYGNVFPHTQVVRIGNEILTKKDTAPTSALNPISQWPNLTIAIGDDKHNASVPHNVSKIGIGVTEYLNDPWKQKTEFFDSPPANVPNYLDGGGEDNGEGRRLDFRPTKKENASRSGSTTTTNFPPTTVIAAKATSTNEKRTPYEFVTEPVSLQDTVFENPKAAIIRAADSRITEPVLKPKPATVGDSLRTRKSQNRPNYGKSINVNNEWHVASTTEVANGRKLTNAVSFPTPGYFNISGQRGNSRPNGDALDFPELEKPQPNDRTLKKGYDAKPKNGSSQLFVVQFLPQRLVSFFEQAERYARLAFLPFIAPQETAKNGPERARRIRTLASRWSGAQAQEPKDKYDLETEESRIVASVVSSPAALTTSSFPYAYQVHQQHLWQHISNLDGSEHKYIPLIHDEGDFQATPPRNDPTAPQMPANDYK